MLLVQFLKNTQLGIFQSNARFQTRTNILIDREFISNFKNRDQQIDLKSPIVFGADDVYAYFGQIENFRVNPFLPKNISDSLKFVGLQPLIGTTISEKNYASNYTRVSINSNNPIFNLDKCGTPEIEMNLGEFIDKYLKCLSEIESWISSHSNFKIDLNI